MNDFYIEQTINYNKILRYLALISERNNKIERKIFVQQLSKLIGKQIDLFGTIIKIENTLHNDGIIDIINNKIIIKSSKLKDLLD